MSIEEDVAVGRVQAQAVGHDVLPQAHLLLLLREGPRGELEHLLSRYLIVGLRQVILTTKNWSLE